MNNNVFIRLNIFWQIKQIIKSKKMGADKIYFERSKQRKVTAYIK